MCGGRLVIAAPDGHRDPAYLNQLMANEWVTTLHVVPSMLDALVSAGLPDSVWRVLAIGEALPAGLAQRLRSDAPRTELFNLYGPTEAAVSITTHRVTAADTTSVPIGVPEFNSGVYVLDDRLHPVPAGVPGELYLAGAQLARGYFGRADLTAERFVARPVRAPVSGCTAPVTWWRWNADGRAGLPRAGPTSRSRSAVSVSSSARSRRRCWRSRRSRRPRSLAKSDPHLGDRLVAYLVPAGASIDTERGARAAERGVARRTWCRRHSSSWRSCR